jgi:hypothetical protein
LAELSLAMTTASGMLHRPLCFALYLCNWHVKVTYEKIGLICVDLFIVAMTAVHSGLAGDSLTAAYNVVFILLNSAWPHCARVV